MPQEINLNISPYFDDFNGNKNYYRVLFKPGLPVQARELTTLQSILQNQVEQVGNHLFKEGSVVIPGQINYNGTLFAVEIEPEYLGVSFEQYSLDITAKVIRGQNSNVKAKVIFCVGPEYSERGYWTLYLNYLGTGIDGKTVFDDQETLLVDEVVQSSVVNFQSGQGFANTAPTNSTSTGSAVILSEGIYFLRGTFVKVENQTLILDAHSNSPTYRVGLEISEQVVTSSQDFSLSDNAKGFNNYAAPGADRLKITATLVKKPLDIEKSENYVELMVIRNGSVSHIDDKISYNVLADELARRTYDQSGDFYVKPFTIIPKESLNNRKGNQGVFTEDQITYSGSVPSETLGTYKISPGKAYIKGYEVGVPNVNYLDFEKTRDFKTLQDQELNYVTGPTLTLNRAFGAPRIGFTTSSVISLRDSRIGTSSSIVSGKEIGIARIYDYALESGSYSASNTNLNQWDISLFDIQTYTELTLNEPYVLNLPTQIQGKSSGSIAYLKYSTTSGIITAYNSKGTFLEGEKLIFNGIENNRVITSINSYSINDAKSVYSLVGAGITFNADTILTTKSSIGQVSITPKSGTAPGISTVTSNTFEFTNIVRVGDIVSFTNTLLGSSNTKSFATVSEISNPYNIKIVGINTVSGICDGGLPTSAIYPVDFSILGSKFQKSTDNTLYTPLPKKWVSNVDLTDSSLTIRKEFAVTINANSTGTIQALSGETFLPFDSERYILVNSSGYIEELTSDKFTYLSGGNSIVISGLSNNTGSGRLIATLRKINIKNKVKNKIRINSIIVNKSKYTSSGIGSTTLNDGLSYGNYGYGLRVQDPDLCLLVPDVVKVYGIFESSDTTDPILPKLSLFNLNGPTGRVEDLLVGEEFIGKESGAVGIFVKKIDSLRLEFVYLNDLKFKLNESIIFQETNISGIIQLFTNGDSNILTRFSLDSGQRDTICDYSRLIRNENSKEPKRKLRIIYESAQYSTSDTGDITTISSYDQFNICDLPQPKENLLLTDIIDIRPRVTPFDATSTGISPFEFAARSYSESNNSSKNILASDESILLSYSHYLPRIDKICLDRNKSFQLITGVAAENPVSPATLDDSLEVATISLPPYICNTKNISVSLAEHKRYRMSDIAVLEQRIKNLEYYTALSLLESKTENLHIPDNNGLNRYKSGIYVDNFTSTNTQLKVAGVTNSIDSTNCELRPSPFTTQVDMVLGTKSILGIGTETPISYNSKFSTNTDLIGTNVRRTGQLITLDYTEFLEVKQPFATRVESVTPYLVTNYIGRIDLFPASDVWIDQVKLETQTINVDNYTETRKQLEFSGYDPQTGLSPVSWGAWNVTWTGSSTNVTNSTVQTGSSTENTGSALVTTNTFQNTQVTTVTQTGTETRGGTQLRLSEQIDTVSEGNRLVSTSVIPFMRSRNVEFTGKKFKPLTRVYGFFDGINVNNFIVPKLIEIRMISGKFNVGELVRGSMSNGTVTETTNTTASISFRVANSNHRYGPIASPTEVFEKSPYDENYIIPADYSTSSILLNVDTATLSDMTQGLYSGFVQTGMRLRGVDGEAEITNVRLFTDTAGVVIGSFFIPNPNILTNPSFETGIKLFKLTSSITNNPLDTVNGTQGEEQYYSQGTINNVQETIRSTRRPRFDSITLSDSRAAQNIQVTTNITSSSTTQVIPLPPPPPPPPEPEPTPVPIPGPTPVEVVFPPQPPPPPPPEPPPPPPPEPPPRRGKDPLAQSFTINNDVGVFATSVDVYFQTKDASLPVVAQLRPMVNGIPSEEVYPFGEVIIDPKDVFLSADASLPTHIVFPSPVYLKPNTDHTLVLLSNSHEYSAWISRMGEVDISTLNQPESRQIVVSSQPLLGSLFKSQNGSNWTPSQYEDLKFNLYTARFSQNNGSISFYNPDLNVGNSQIATLVKDSIELNSKKIIITLNNTANISNLTLGNTVIQTNTNASGNYVGAGGSATGTLNIINAGIGYTPSNGSNFTFNNVPLTSLTGSGKNATANITVGQGVAIAATISSGGSGYQIGDIFTASQIGSQTLGRNLQLSLSNLSGTNEIILDDVQGEFEVSASKNVQYITSSGITSSLLTTSSTNALITNIELNSQYEDGLHIKIYHKNHGMHSDINEVSISNVSSDVQPTTLSVQYLNSDSGSISIANTSNFNTFENVSVASTNPGYILIDNEIISYTGVLNGQLIGITRGIDQTRSFSYANGSIVKKYELNQISLRRINKIHSLQDATVDNSIGLDYYYLKLDTSSNGVDRSVGTSFPKLFIAETKSAGGSDINATQNIQFEIVKPILQSLILPQTNIKGQIKTITGTSVSGNEISFEEMGYVSMDLEEETYFNSPRLIASKLNEVSKLNTIPGNKSMEMVLNLSTANSCLSPVIDLDRTGMVLISNRVNKIITDYAIDGRSSSIIKDPTAFIYANKPVALENSATSLKVILSAYVNVYSEVRAFYSVSNNLENDLVYYPFPGYTNLDVNGNIIDIAKNNGLPNKFVSPTDILSYKSNDIIFTDREFSIDNLPEFRYFSIKLIGTSTNQAFPPRIKDFRVIALA
jgi:hypothetical protein